MTVAEIMEAVKGLKVLELAELVKALEEEFGVSAMPVAVAGAAGGAAAPAAEEKTEFDVKEKVDGAPAIIKEAASKEDAESIKAQLEEAGAKVTLK